MKKQTKNTPTLTSNSKKIKSFAVGSRGGQIFAQVPYTAHDFKNALLIASVTTNVFFLTLWLTTQVSDSYAMSVARLIAN